MIRIEHHEATFALRLSVSLFGFKPHFSSYLQLNHEDINGNVLLFNSSDTNRKHPIKLACNFIFLSNFCFTTWFQATQNRFLRGEKKS